MSLSTPPVPRLVHKALADLREMRQRGIPGLGDADEDLSDLWLSASWQRASNLGMGPVEYARWITVGIWNFANRPEQLAAAQRFRELGGEKGWLLAAAGFTPEAAAEQMRENGRSAVLEGAEAIITLSRLGTILDPAWEPPEDEEEPAPQGPVWSQPARPQHGPIDFS